VVNELYVTRGCWHWRKYKPKEGCQSPTKEDTDPREYSEKELTMLERLGRMLMRILLVVGGEVAGNRSHKIDDMAGS